MAVKEVHYPRAVFRHRTLTAVVSGIALPHDEEHGRASVLRGTVDGLALNLAGQPTKLVKGESPRWIVLRVQVAL